MKLETFLIAILYISIGCLFTEICVIFKNLKSRLHAFLLLSCIATTINNIGYLLMLQSTTKEACLTALKFSYTGRVWISFSLCMFVAELCHKKVATWMKAVLVTINVLVYGTILTVEQHQLYYSSIEYVTDGLFPIIHHGNGIVHHCCQ